jgi:hypothetical protein
MIRARERRFGIVSVSGFFSLAAPAFGLSEIHACLDVCFGASFTPSTLLFHLSFDVFGF